MGVALLTLYLSDLLAKILLPFLMTLGSVDPEVLVQYSYQET